MLDALVFEHVVQLVYEGSLNDLWLLSGGRSADGRGGVAIGGCVARVGGSFSLRLGLRLWLRLEGARSIAIGGAGGRAVDGRGPHGGRGRGRDVHGVSWGRQSRGGRWQNGYRLVKFGVMRIGGEGT
jgi:hypothetical protein